MPARKKQFCKWGHDTHKVGRTKNGQCKACANNRTTVWRWTNIDRQREIWRAAKKRYSIRNRDHINEINRLSYARKRILKKHWELHLLRREGVTISMGRK